MKAVEYPEVRIELASTMDRVCADHEVVVITREKAGSVVMLSLEDYDALVATASGRPPIAIPPV